MNRIYVQIIALFVSGLNLILAQPCDFTIRGEISDLHDGVPIIGALIRIQGTDFFSQTALDGTYQITNLCPGNYILEVSHPKCTTIKKNIRLKGSLTTNFNLEHHINELDEIILSDSRIAQLNKSLQQVSLDLNDLSSFGGNTLEEALNSIPGAAILKTGAAIAKPIIHGMYGSRVGIVTDGFRQFDQEWGPDHAPFVDFDSFETLQLVKGAAALKYGGDTPGGLLILSSKRKILKDTLFGKTNLNVASNGMGGKWNSMIEKNFSNGFFLKGLFTLKRFGDFNTPNYNLSNTGFFERDFSFYIGVDKFSRGWKLNYSNFNTEAGVLRGAHIGNVQDLFYALNASEPRIINAFTYAIDAPKQQGRHQKVSFKHFTLLKNKWKLEWGYNYQANRRKEFDVRRGGLTDTPAIDLLLQSHSVMGSMSALKFKNWNFEIGMSGLLQDNYSNPNTGVKRLIPDYLKYEAGIYFLGNFQKNNSFIWEWGVRMDYVFNDAKKYYYTEVWKRRGFDSLFKEFERQTIGNQILTNPKLHFLNFSGQTGFTKRITENTNLNASYILSQRAPNPSELFSDGLHHSIAAIEYGSLTLQKETSHKLILSLSESSKKINYSIEPYFSMIKNYIYIEPTGLLQTIRGAFPVWTYRSTEAIMTGIDFNSRVSINALLSLDVGASYTYAQDINNREPLILIPPFNTFQKLRYASKTEIWNIELSHQMRVKQTRFPDSNFEFNMIEGGQLVSKVVDISDTPKGFHLFDLAFSFQLKKKKTSVRQIRLILQNITNTTYRDYLNRLRFYADEMGRNVRVQLNYNF